MTCVDPPAPGRDRVIPSRVDPPGVGEREDQQCADEPQHTGVQTPLLEEAGRLSEQAEQRVLQQRPHQQAEHGERHAQTQQPVPDEPPGALALQ